MTNHRPKEVPRPEEQTTKLLQRLQSSAPTKQVRGRCSYCTLLPCPQPTPTRTAPWSSPPVLSAVRGLECLSTWSVDVTQSQPFQRTASSQAPIVPPPLESIGNMAGRGGGAASREKVGMTENVRRNGSNFPLHELHELFMWQLSDSVAGCAVRLRGA